MTNQCSSRIDNEVGSNNIASYFSQIYQLLYINGDELKDVSDIISCGIKNESKAVLGKVLSKECFKLDEGWQKTFTV